mmetsp:Transcript_3697/g.7031  ORF Transcript_3697/g.7031 Transcript_3697/m.7031 type:complete len:607 (+) Transcript_3697:126-1946(+)
MEQESDSLSMKSLGSISVLESEKLGEHYMQRLQESDGDITRTVDLFFRDHWPKKNLCDDESRNLKAFLTYVGYRNRLMTRMSKIGTGVKITLSLFLGYFDIITDFLVCRAYYLSNDTTTAYSTASFAILALCMQAVLTFYQYAKKGWRERLTRSLLALVGLGPAMEGYKLWNGKEDPDVVLAGPVIYASMKAIEVGIEAIPEGILQVIGLLRANRDDIQFIQLLGLAVSVVSGAFILTDGNFGLISSKRNENIGDRYYCWISRVKSERYLQMIGMFLFNLCYFPQFCYSMSLFAKAYGSGSFGLLIGTEFFFVCVYMAYKRELFGFSMIAHPSKLDYSLPFVGWTFYYLLTSAVPLLIAGAPMELGPELFAGILVWRLAISGPVVYLSLIKLGSDHYLSQSTGMGIYAATAVGACLGLLIFMMNCDKNFEKALFWRPKSGKQHVLDSCQSKTIRKTFCKTKDDEIWLLWVESVHPAYLPFDFITKWICEDLVDKYTGLNNLEERPEWMIGDKEALFLKRIVTIYTWYGNEADLRAVNEAIFKLTGRSGDDMKPKPGIKSLMTFIKPDEGSTDKVATPKGIKSRIMVRTPVRIEPSPEPSPDPEIDV